MFVAIYIPNNRYSVKGFNSVEDTSYYIISKRCRKCKKNNDIACDAEWMVVNENECSEKELNLMEKYNES